MSTVAVIGAGPSGLTSVKTALECGLKPTAFEKSGDIGGLWKGETSAWDGMHTNLSRFCCMFSDFPWKPETQLFPTRSEMHDYLHQYADHFSLIPHIRLRSEVLDVQRDESFWKVTYRENSSTLVRFFHHVIIAGGVFSKPYIPPIPGLESFEGLSLHSQEYKNPSLFDGKRVFVIGNSFSGSEIAAEVASVAHKVTHVIRRPYWELPRYLPQESKMFPLDFVFYTRAGREKSQGLLETAVNFRKHTWFQNISAQQAVHPALAIEPSIQPPFVAISDTYLQAVRCQKIDICLCPSMSIDGQTVVLHDGNRESADALIFCTGFRMNLSFLDPKILQIIEFEADDPLQPLILYDCTLHPSLPSMAFVGLYRGPFFGVIELQARLACMTFSRECSLPSEEEMMRGLTQERDIRNKIPRPQFPHGDYIALADQIAADIGVLPSTSFLEKEEREFRRQFWEGPYLPTQFRLTGPHSKPTLARQLMNAAWDLTRSPQVTHLTHETEST